MNITIRRTAGCTAEEMARWERSRRQAAKTAPRRPHVDWSVRLYRIASGAFTAVAGFGALCLVFVFWEIVGAFLSGRVHDLLQQALKGGR